MPTQINHLGEPNLNLTVVPGRNGELTIELSIPRTSGSLQNIPFLEVTRNEREHLLYGAQQELIGRLSRSGLRIEQIDFNMQQGSEASIGGNIRLGKFTIGVTDQRGVDVNISNNPSVRDAIRAAERNFDTNRTEIYEQRALEWARQGGATLTSGGKTYSVTQDAAADYYDQRNFWKPWDRAPRADAGNDVQVASAGPLSQDPRFAAIVADLRGQKVGVDAMPDTAAAVYQTAQLHQFRPDEQLRLLRNTSGDGLILSQGDEVSGKNALLKFADVKPGTWQELASSLSNQQQTHQQPAQPVQEQEQVRRPQTLA
jgi:hypothetical protein